MECFGVRPLEPRQAKFVEEYLIDLNQTKAAIRAGYAENGASTQAVRLLAKANIQEAIRLRRAKISKATPTPTTQNAKRVPMHGRRSRVRETRWIKSTSPRRV